MSVEETMAEKIGKLLAKAERTDNQHEAEAFMAHAERLMIKWGINEAMARSQGQKPKEEITKEILLFDKRYGKALIIMMHTVVEAHGLRGFYSGNNYVIVGHKSDALRMQMLCLSLQMQATTAMWNWWKNDEETGLYSGLYTTAAQETRARRNFFYSFGVAVRNRVREIRKEETDSTPGAALVLRGREEELDEFMSGLGLNKTGQFTFGHNEAGYQSGMKAEINETRVENRAHAAID